MIYDDEEEKAWKRTDLCYYKKVSEDDEADLNYKEKQNDYVDRGIDSEIF